MLAKITGCRPTRGVDNPPMKECEPSHHPEAKTKPAKTPYLHIRTVEGLLGEAIAITGNAAALLKLRARVDRALNNETTYPFEVGSYQDVNGIPLEVAIKRAKSRAEMREPVPR